MQEKASIAAAKSESLECDDSPHYIFSFRAPMSVAYAR